MSLKVFHNIGELLTLAKAARKQARGPMGDADLSILTDAVLVASQGRIVWCGTRAEFNEALLSQWSQGREAERVDLGGRTILPAFVEPHSHLIFAGNRAHEFEWRMQGQTYQQISAQGGGILSTVRATRAASDEELFNSAQARAEVFLRQGVTTLEVKSGYGLDHDTELRCLRIAGRLRGPRIVRTYLGAHSRSPDYQDLKSYVAAMCERTLPQIARERLAERVDIYIEKGFFDLNLGRRYLQCARDLGFAVTAHVEQLCWVGGIELAVELGAQSADHAVYASEEGLKRLAASETTAVLLPTSDFYLRMDYPPARKMLDQGVRVALGTDFNPGTSPTQDLTLTGLLARLHMQMSLPEVIVALTLGGAHALNKGAELGSLEEGKSCDFSMLPGSWRDLFYSVGHHPVAGVFKEGVRVF